MSPSKKIAAVLAVVVVAGLATLALYHRGASSTSPMATDYKTAVLHIGALTIHADVADTAKKRELGLANRTSLEEGQGMWFVFDKDGLWPFWMKDTVIPLDMLWVDASSTIVFIQRDVQPESYPQAFAPETPARYVLELPGGYAEKMQITEGMQVLRE